MKNVISLSFLLFVFYSCSQTSKQLIVTQYEVPKVDTSIVVEIIDTLSVKINNLLDIEIALESDSSAFRIIHLQVVNRSSNKLYFDTLSLDQYLYDKNHNFLYGPDLNCHLPMYFFSVQPDEILKISSLKIEKSIDTVSISLCGTRNITKLKEEVLGDLDTIYSQNGYSYRFKYDCKIHPKMELFSIQIQGIPVQTMRGKVKIRINGV